MANLTADPFAAMVEPGVFAQAVAESLQLSLLPKRQYFPLGQPSRAGGPGRSASDDDEADGQDGGDAGRFDSVDTGPGGFIAVDPVRRVG